MAAAPVTAGRTLRVESRAKGRARVRVTVKGVETVYDVARTPTGWAWVEFGESEGYSASFSACTCEGFRYGKPGDRCRHVAGNLALAAVGKLPG